MFKIDSDTNTIYLTRGDSANLTLKIADYIFVPGDKIEFRVYNKKGMNELPLIDEIVDVEEECESIDIQLTSEMTKIGEIANKPITYWYEIELNDDATVIGYDENGAKELILYPEGEEKEEMGENNNELIDYITEEIYELD